MPDHVHGILVLTDHLYKDVSRNAPTDVTTKRKSLGRLIGAFKTVSTKQINWVRNTPGIPAWQRNYYERIIRDEKALHAIQNYIQNNPIAWHDDNLHPNHLQKK